MPKWEYITDAFNNLEKGLNEYGERGWELVTCWRNNRAQTFCIFKRPREE